MADLQVLSKEEAIISQKDQEIADLIEEIEQLQNGQKPMLFNWKAFWVMLVSIAVTVIYVFIGSLIPTLLDETLFALVLSIIGGFIAANGIQIKKSPNK